ncbi:MAG: ribonuclease HII [Leptospirales bacterium]
MEPLEWDYIRKFSAEESSGYFIAADEVGRGSLFGPVSVGAISVPFSYFNEGPEYKTPPFHEWHSEIRDSKKLSAKKRNYLSEKIISNFSIRVSHVSVGYIDKYNINRAIQYALYRAVQSLKLKHPSGDDPAFILLDGNYRFQYPMLGMSSAMPPIHTIIGGDDRLFSIGCASIVAKVERDAMIAKASEKFPEYNLASNAGYGTLKHREALASSGMSIHHRKSFLKKMVIGNKS